MEEIRMMGDAVETGAVPGLDVRIIRYRPPISAQRIYALLAEEHRSPHIKFHNIMGENNYFY
jgi:hypothetical protein